jgi:hypothetical protein
MNVIVNLSSLQRRISRFRHPLMPFLLLLWLTVTNSPQDSLNGQSARLKSTAYQDNMNPPPLKKKRRQESIPRPDSSPFPCVWVDEDISCLWPRGRCDRRSQILSVFLCFQKLSSTSYALKSTESYKIFNSFKWNHWCWCVCPEREISSIYWAHLDTK